MKSMFDLNIMNEKHDMIDMNAIDDNNFPMETSIKQEPDDTDNRVQYNYLMDVEKQDRLDCADVEITIENSSLCKMEAGPSGFNESMNHIEPPAAEIIKIKLRSHRSCKDNANESKKSVHNRDENTRKKEMQRKARVWTCKKCPSVFNKYLDLKTHRKTHREVEKSEHIFKYDDCLELYICGTCSAEFQFESEAKQHLRNHEELYQCNECKEKFTKLYNYSIHMSNHYNDGLFHCMLCSHTFAKRSSLLSHTNYVHLKKFFYSCTSCGKGFNDVVLFKEHNDEHLGVKGYNCIVCEKEFKNSRYLLSHQKQYHRVGIEGQLHPNQCEICQKIFSKGTTLQYHKRRHERAGAPREKRHLCDLCGQGFSQKHRLKSHYRVHTGVKPFKCSYCTKCFTKKEYLVLHERIHSGEKPYICSYCGKSFNQSAPLRIHTRSHTGERPYICNFCSAGFASKGALSNHMKNCLGPT